MPSDGLLPPTSRELTYETHMTDLLDPPPQQTTEPAVEFAETTPIPDRAAIIELPPDWFQGLSAKRKTQIVWFNVAELKLHPACDFLPFYARSYTMVLASIRDVGGVLFPLAIAPDGRVLDGRYRLQA